MFVEGQQPRWALAVPQSRGGQVFRERALGTSLSFCAPSRRGCAGARGASRAQGGRAAGWTGCVRRGLAGTAELLARCLSDSTPQACSRTHTVEGLSSPGSPLSVPLWASGQTAAGHLPGRRICMSPTWECGLWPGRVGQSTCVSSSLKLQRLGERGGPPGVHVRGCGHSAPRPAPGPAPRPAARPRGGAVPAASTMASACLLLRGWGGPVALSCPQAPPPESEGPTSGASG